MPGPSPATAVQAGIGVVQAGIGIAQSISGNKRLKRLLQQREDYKAPDEIMQQFQMAQQQAQTGYSSETLAYLTKNTNNSLTSSLDAATKLGGNPNDIASIFSRNVDAIMKTASDSELAKVQKFDKLYTAIAGVVQAKDAEFADRRAKHDDLVAREKDKIDAAKQNIQSGVNAITGAVANSQTSKLGTKNITPSTAAVNTLPVSASSSSTLPALGTTVTGAPLGGRSVAPTGNPGAAPDYSQLLNFWQMYNGG